MLVKQEKNVSLKLLKKAKHNPARRSDPARLNNLIKSIQEVGLLYPVLITEDMEIIDGHRRLAAYEKMEMETIPCKVVEGDQAHLYRSVNFTAARLSANDIVGVWLKNPEAVPARKAMIMEEMEQTLGRPMVEEIYERGSSHRTYHLAKGLARSWDMDNPQEIKRIIKWIWKHAMMSVVSRAVTYPDDFNRASLQRAIHADRAVRIKTMLTK